MSRVQEGDNWKKERSGVRGHSILRRGEGGGGYKEGVSPVADVKRKCAPKKQKGGEKGKGPECRTLGGREEAPGEDRGRNVDIRRKSEENISA